MSNIILNSNNKIIGSSNNQQTDNSIIVDQYGYRIRAGGFKIEGVLMKRYDNVYGFYCLNDLHRAVRQQLEVYTTKKWKNSSPSHWYRPKGLRRELKDFLDITAEYCPLPYSDRNGPAKDIDIPTYVTISQDSKLVETDKLPKYKPYPIEVIEHGTYKGIYGPVATLLMYVMWLYPALHATVVKLAFNMVGERLFDTTSSNLVMDVSDYHSIAEAEYTFSDRYNEYELDRISHRYPSGYTVNTWYDCNKYPKSYHVDVWWDAYGIPSDSWYK
jgi:hypothetical protein